MRGTRNTLTARFGAGLSHRVEERALWGDVAPRVSCQQCETPVHAAVDLADPGPGGPVASGCVGRAQHTPDRTWRTGGGAGAVLVLRGHAFPWGFIPVARTALPGAVLVVGPFPHKLLPAPSIRVGSP